VTSDTIAWPKGTGGSTAAPDSLRRKPMQPGETRTLSTFLPLFNRVAVNTLTARAKEKIDVDGASRELLRIESASRIDAQTTIDVTLWTDEQGEVWKLDLPLIQQVTIRTTAEKARAASNAPPVDLGKSLLVKVEPPLKGAHKTTEVKYRVAVEGADVAKLFPASEGQSVKVAGDGTGKISGTAEVTVTAVRPTTPLPAGFTPTPPTERDKRANSVVQSDDAEVAKLAAAGAGAETDPWKVALRLESFVHAKMNAAALGDGFDFSKAFASAAETARTLQGDCTEHAVLLCAMLRARGIPARTVMGLVYVEGGNAFAYHLWTEAYIADRWIPLDATVGHGGTSAAYLKLVDTNLDGIDSFTAFLPLLNVVGRLKVEVVEQR
jgi:transglutaminase-like putative cysteine protease